MPGCHSVMSLLLEAVAMVRLVRSHRFTFVSTVVFLLGMIVPYSGLGTCRASLLVRLSRGP